MRKPHGDIISCHRHAIKAFEEKSKIMSNKEVVSRRNGGVGLFFLGLKVIRMFSTEQGLKSGGKIWVI